MIFEFMKLEEHLIVALALCNYRKQCFVKVTNSTKAESFFKDCKEKVIFIADGVRYKLVVAVDIPDDHIFVAYSIPDEFIVERFGEYGDL